MLLLRSYRWPGNVRELENVLMRAVITAPEDTITADILPDILSEDKAEAKPEVVVEVGTTLQEAEKKLIRKTLELVEGNKSKAAKILGVSRKAMYNKLKKHGLR
jgi:DNA-binding NtrC family response regulator